jgi:hypothetical protein
MSRQFQGSLGPFQDLESERPPASQNPHLEPWTINNRAKHTARDGCGCVPCRKSRMDERRSMEPLSLREKIYIYGSLWAGGGILVLFAYAALSS